MDATACTLITGGTGVVGRAIVRRLAEEGRRVCLTYHSDAVTAAAMVADGEDRPGEVIAVKADLVDLDAAALIDAVEERAGHISSFVHAAALVDHTPLDKLDRDRFQRVLDVNVTAPYLLARELASRGTLSHLVLISSIAASITDLGSVAYTTSKGAIDTLTRALAVHLPASIRVNAVAPGIVRSHRTESDPLLSGDNARIRSSALVEPDDVAAVISYLLNESPAGLRGQEITVDSGLSSTLL